MYDAASPYDTSVLQRATGELAVAVRLRDGVSVLDRLRQAGCLKARFPHRLAADWMDVVTLNTSGGVVGGDRLDTSIEVRRGARVSIAAQAAERFYRAVPGSVPSRVRARIAVDAGAAAEWLPQETILFDRCTLDRRLEVELAEDAWFLGVESLVFGRAAMGEVMTRASVHDLIRIRRGGRLLLHDPVRLDGDVVSMLQRPAIAADARALATVFHVAPGVEAKVAAVREVLKGEAGASAWDGMLIVRILAPTGAALRSAVVAVLGVLRDGRPLPRVWHC